MRQPDASRIAATLQSEVPEFAHSRSFVTFLSLLMMLLFSMAIGSAVVCAAVGGLAIYTRNELSEATYLAVAAITPIVCLFIGYLTKDSLTSPGSRIAEGALNRQTTSWGPGYGKDDQSAEVGFGCFLFLLQALAGGVYSSAVGLLSFAKPGHDKERELAVSIVGHLLEHGATPTNDLVESLAQQGVPRDLAGTTLGLLRKASILEPSPDRLALSPAKRHVFDGCL